MDAAGGALSGTQEVIIITWSYLILGVARNSTPAKAFLLANRASPPHQVYSITAHLYVQWCFPRLPTSTHRATPTRTFNLSRFIFFCTGAFLRKGIAVHSAQAFRSTKLLGNDDTSTLSPSFHLTPKILYS